MLAALPETYLTAQGALDALGIRPGGTVADPRRDVVGGAGRRVDRDGHGVEIAATTRRPDKVDALTAAGVDHVAPRRRRRRWRRACARSGPTGPDHVLDLVGASTVVDSLQLVRRGGTVCVAGSLSGWLIPNFEPIAMIPSGTKLTAFHSDTVKGSAGAAVLQRVVHEVEAGVYRPNVDRVFGLDDIAAAHR